MNRSQQEFLKKIGIVNDERFLKNQKEFLLERGLLEVSLDDENLDNETRAFFKQKILEAKFIYKKESPKAKKQQSRKNKKRYDVELSIVGKNSEYALLKRKAGKKKIGQCLREWALAYLKNEYVVSDEKIVSELIKEIAAYRNDRNKEGRNVKKIIDDAMSRGYPIPEDLLRLYNNLYNLNNINMTFDLEKLVMKALRSPHERFFEFVEKKLNENPILISDLEKIITNAKIKNDYQESSMA